ncbi:MAG TPA: hypothetical protein ENF81_04975 [Thermotogaceae bacterium]|nr:hypothetical protein [Thermotogaceae bacterium]
MSDDLFEIVRMFILVQKQRVAFNNRARTLEFDNPVIEQLAEFFQTTEESLEKSIKREIKHEPIYKEFFSKVKGIGPILAAKIMYYIRDIGRFPNVAKLWRYAGLAVINGKAETLQRGQKISYRPEFKATMYVVGSSMLKARSKYVEIYYAAKDYYARNRDWGKQHIHLAAMRKMEKLFLAHLWEVWRQLEGYPIRMPYAVEYLGHTTILTPEMFISA